MQERVYDSIIRSFRANAGPFTSRTMTSLRLLALLGVLCAGAMAQDVCLMVAKVDSKRSEVGHPRGCHGATRAFSWRAARGVWALCGCCPPEVGRKHA